MKRWGVPSPHDTSTAGNGFVIARFIPAASANISLDRWDLFFLSTMLLLWFCLLVLPNDSLPLQIYDEARLADGALDMVRSGHWLIPTYSGVPDHWSVKPPLLLWQMAALVWLGLPTLLAVRLPTMLAALATVGTMWAVCRYTLRDRVAAVLAGLLLLSSSYYTDVHIARTGDYEVPLSFFTLLYVLAFWASSERDNKVHTTWFAIFAIGLVLAVMTKGVAGTFGLIGLFLFSLMRGRLVTLITNLTAWSLALIALLLCLGYYGSRELYDPGYLQAVWQNELGGRFSSALEGHAQGRLFYIKILMSFEPGIIMVLLPLATFTLLGVDARRRSLATLCVLCAATILLVLTAARSKIYWYATPIFPLLAIVAALGVSDGLCWIKVREPLLPKLFRVRSLKVALGILLAVVSAAPLYRNLVQPRVAEQTFNGQLWYGALLDKLRSRGDSSVIVLDGGFEGAGNYNPVLQFYADIARKRGLRATLPALDTIPFDVIVHDGAFEGVRQHNPYADIARMNDVQENSSLLPYEELVATCDPRLIPWLRYQNEFSIDGQVHSCIFGVARKS